MKTTEGKPIEIVCVYQGFDSLPDFYSLPEGRTKPYGTTHATLCAKDVVNEPFAVINADDYYGAEAFRVIYDVLPTLAPSAQTLSLSPQNFHFMYPKFNGRWLVYLDAKIDEGGAIMAVDLTSSPLKPVKVKDIYSGQPEPFLSENYVAFMDRTGTTRDKLFVYDLTTMESTVVAMFTNSVYGQSKPFIADNTLIWAGSATSGGSSDTSLLNYIYINSSTVKSVDTGTFIHDPECNRHYTAWLTEVHSRDTQLYGMEGFGGAPFLIDSGVVEFGLGSDFAAYSRDEGIYVYMFDSGSIYRLTQDYEQAMFLGVSDDHVMWMDVTSRERDIV